jgi:hypothetical protein
VWVGWAVHLYSWLRDLSIETTQVLKRLRRWLAMFVAWSSVYLVQQFKPAVPLGALQHSLIIWHECSRMRCGCNTGSVFTSQELSSEDISWSCCVHRTGLDNPLLRGQR